MRRFLSATGNFVTSLAGRIAIILTLGTTFAAILSLAAAEHFRQHEFQRFRAERIALSAADLLRRLDEAPQRTRILLKDDGIIGAHLLKAPPREVRPADPDLRVALASHLPAGRDATGYQGQIEDCYGPFSTDLKRKFSHRAAGFVAILPECWIVSMRSPAEGRPILMAFDVPALRLPPSNTLNPAYLLMILVAAAALSLLVSRLALRSLRTLTAAAHAFSHDIDADPIAEAGPSDVREAFAAFNIMQRRVREGIRERTRILAAISHDLQTPLTRMRLRLDTIENEDLRDRLIGDLGTMLRLVREGLSLARSSDSVDDWAVLDLDSLLASLVDDAVQAGLNVRLLRGCGVMVRTKPDALARVLQNLVDNAVRYGERAEVSAACVNAALRIEIRDHGAGIPEPEIERMFDPFVRGEESRSRATGGTGIGLTIARAQAGTFGGTVTLANAPDGGLIASVEIPVSEIVRDDLQGKNGRSGLVASEAAGARPGCTVADLTA